MLTAGDLDPTFGVGGKVLTDFIGPLSSNANALAVQSDGKIVVTGSAGSAVNGQFFSHFALARFNPEGSLDPAFGISGRVSIDFGKSQEAAKAAAIQTDGKIVAVGFPFGVARFNPNGSLDSSFGTGGKVITFSGGADAGAVAIQPDGKIVVVGGGGVAQLGVVVQLVRYNVDGSLDPTFGTTGKVTAPFGGALFAGSGAAAVIQPDGRIVLGGNDRDNNLELARFNPNGSEDTSFGQGGLVTSSIVGQSVGARHIALQADAKIIMVGSNKLARYNADGSLDSSFGNGGIVTTVSRLDGVTVQSDGKIVVAGGGASPDPSHGFNFVVGRFNPDGSVDSGFGAGGFATTTFGGGSYANGVAILSGGRILAVGGAAVSSANKSGVALVSYNPDGSLDTTFGQSGKVLTYFLGVTSASANALVLQPDGKIVVVGADFDIARYAADGSLDASFGSGGRIITPFAAPGDAANGIALQNDGKIVVVGRVTGLFALARYNLDGNLDTSFGTGGKVTTDLGSDTVAGQVVIQPNGKIVVVGTADSKFTLARYNSDGSLDAGFGSVGIITTAPSVGASASMVVLQPDGKIIVAGNTSYFSGGLGGTTGYYVYSLFLTRYNSDGTADTAFGTNGQATYPTVYEFVNSFQPGVALQADGRIVVAGPVNENFGVLRLLTNGQVDPSFGTSGLVTTVFAGNELPKSVAIQTDGKIIVAGRTGGVPQGQFALARYAADGSLDSSFGHGGKVTTDFGDHMDSANAIVLQPDGKIVAAGATIRNVQSPVGLDSSFGVVRYLTDNLGTANQRFVEELYWDLLRRPVDSSGLASWSGQLDQGLSHTQVATAIQSSPEYHALVVGDLYKLVLGRAVDASGLTTWVTFLNQGHPAEQLEAILLGSDEFFVSHGNQDNQLFLSALYLTVLQRPIDSSGAQGWGQALQSGALSRQAVAAAVLASVESDRLEVQTLYMQFLDRAADPSGLDTFTTALQRGVSNEQIAILLMSSAEYFARV